MDISFGNQLLAEGGGVMRDEVFVKRIFGSCNSFEDLNYFLGEYDNKIG